MNTSAAFRSIVAALAVAGLSSTAEAQVCTGSAPFSNGLIRVGLGGGNLGAGFGAADGHASLGLRFALGAAKGPFASMGASAAFYGSPPERFVRAGLIKDTLDDAGSANVNLSAGYHIRLPQYPNVAICPIVGLTAQSGPSLADCVSLPTGGKTCSGAGNGSGRALWGGGSIGAVWRRAPKQSITPFVTIAWVRSRITARGRDAAETYAEATLGVGVTLNRLTIRPAASIPMGLSVGDPGFGIEVGFNFGSKR